MSTDSPPNILIVDDEPYNIRLINLWLRAEGYTTTSAATGQEALDAIAITKPDLILLDIGLPDTDGFLIAQHLKSDPATHHIPIIMITGLDDRASKLRALHVGAEDFLAKPIDQAELVVRVRNLVRLHAYGKLLANHNKTLEQKVTERTLNLQDSYREAICTLHRAASYRDEETGTHILRVAYYCLRIAKHLGLGTVFCDHILYASPMHDIGKIAIPDSILFKPAALSPAEWLTMQTHTTIGAHMLDGTRSPYLDMGREIALSHHERWDGSGYPNHRSQSDIPLPARIMHIADIYDALRSVRPYKPAFSHDRTLEIIFQGDGRTLPSHFDPTILTAFQACATEFENIFAEFSIHEHSFLTPG